MLKLTLLLFISPFICFASPQIDSNTIKMPFIKNIGQAPKHVAYYIDTPKASIFLNEKGDINYNFIQKNTNKSVVIKESMSTRKLDMEMQNFTSAKVNAIKGKDSNKWHHSIPNSSEILFGEVWDGIDVKLVARPGNIEKIFTVKPFSNTKNILLSLHGTTEPIKIHNEQLVLSTALGSVTFTKPIAWQIFGNEKIYVPISYRAVNNQYGFNLGKYDQAKELIIDPLLGSTYAGGNLDEIIAGIHVNSNNEIIVAGATSSINFPTTVGVINEANTGSYDFVAMKFNSDMSQLLASTYLGGSGYDVSSVVAFDSSDNIYFAGESRSSDFPFPDSPYIPYQENEDPNGSIFITILSADFTQVLGATHIGGDIVDLVRNINIAPNGDVYITGFTNSNNYPYTDNAFEQSGKGIIVSAFNPDLSQLIYSTRVGEGDGLSINFDSDGSIFIAGSKTGVQQYTTTIGAFRETPFNSLGEQIYLAHLSQDLHSLISATFIDFGTPNLIKFTPDNQILVSVRTTNGGFPVPITAFDNTQLLGGSTTLFTMDKNMSTINSASFIDLAFDTIHVEPSGDILVFGLTSTQDFPGGNNPTDPLNTGYHGGPQDFAIARLNPDLTQVTHASYIGGSGNELSAKGLAIDTNGNVIIAGLTTSNDVFLTENAYDTLNDGNGDFIILKATSDLIFGPFVNEIFCDSFESPIANGVCN